MNMQESTFDTHGFQSPCTGRWARPAGRRQCIRTGYSQGRWHFGHHYWSKPEAPESGGSVWYCNRRPRSTESWEVADDGLSVTLNLVAGAVFHDGEPITSEDVAFSVKTIQENHPFKTMFAPVTSVETPDAQTAILQLSQPHPALMLAMSSQLMPIIPKHIYGDGQDPKSHPRNSEDVVGSGPFKLVEFERDQHVIVERFDDFFMEGRPYLDKMVMRIIKDPSAFRKI